jgi:hypothetical protein
LSSDEDYIAFQQLKKDAIAGAIWRKVQDKPEYIERLKEELSVIKKLKFSKYFLTYSKIMELVSKEMLVGPARGCFLPGTLVKKSDSIFQNIEDIKIGTKVIDAYGNHNMVTNVFGYDINEECIELTFENNKIIKCTKDHEFLTKNRGWIKAIDLTEDDDIIEV